MKLDDIGWHWLVKRASGLKFLATPSIAKPSRNAIKKRCVHDDQNLNNYVKNPFSKTWQKPNLENAQSVFDVIVRYETCPTLNKVRKLRWSTNLYEQLNS